MLWLVLGGLTLIAFVAGLRGFERASVATVRALFVWLAALGGLSLALLLFLNGRGSLALGAVVMFGPLIWDWWRGTPRAARSDGTRSDGTRAGASSAPRQSPGGMTPEEAWQVLGLQPGADAAAIRAAHRRLMRAAHPDVGGSDWLATRINQARDIALRMSR